MSLTWTPETDNDPEFTVTTASLHSTLAGRSTADAHPASAITTDNDWNGNLTAAGTNLAAVLDVIDNIDVSGGVDSVNGETGTVVLTAADVGADPSGTAADAIAALPEWADGIGSALDESVTGFVSIDRTGVRFTGTATGVHTTTTETTLLTATSSVTDAQLDTVLHVCLVGTLTNNTVANRDVTLRVKVGAITTATFAFTAIGYSASPRTWRIDLLLQAVDFFGHRITGTGRCSLSAAGAGLDFGSITAAAVSAGTFTDGDTLTIDCTAQHSTSSASLIAYCTTGTVARYKA